MEAVFFPLLHACVTFSPSSFKFLSRFPSRSKHAQQQTTTTAAAAAASKVLEVGRLVTAKQSKGWIHRARHSIEIHTQTPDKSRFSTAKCDEVFAVRTEIGEEIAEKDSAASGLRKP
jgi:hypothetical protein